MYLEADLAAGTSATTEPGNGETKKHLSTIEITLIAGTIISGISLVINIWNSTRRAPS